MSPKNYDIYQGHSDMGKTHFKFKNHSSLLSAPTPESLTYSMISTIEINLIISRPSLLKNRKLIL